MHRYLLVYLTESIELLLFEFPNEDEKIKTCDSVKLSSGVYYTSL